MSYLGAVRSSAPPVVTGNLNGDGATVEVDCTGFTTALVQAKADGSWDPNGGEAVYFEVTLNGTDWLRAMYFWSEQGADWSAGTQQLASLAGMEIPVYVPLHGAVGFRVRQQTNPNAGGVDVWVGLSMVAAAPPARTIEIAPVSGSEFVVTNNGTSDPPLNIATLTTLPVAGNVGIEPVFQQATLTADDEACTAFGSQLTIQVVGAFTGDLVAEVGLDGTNWVPLDVSLITDLSTGAAVTALGEGMFTVEVTGPIGLRVRADNSFSGPSDVSILGITI